jgi:hypothetical protein
MAHISDNKNKCPQTGVVDGQMPHLFGRNNRLEKLV